MSNEQVAPETKGVTVKLLSTVDLIAMMRDRGNNLARQISFLIMIFICRFRKFATRSRP